MEVLGQLMKMDFDIQNIFITKHTDYKGFKIRFRINQQQYILLVGKTSEIFPLSLIHSFNEREKCKPCNKLVFPSNISQQVCPFLFNRKRELLAYFQENCAELFPE